MEQLSFHPIANIYPLLEGEDLQALVVDIGLHGLLSPIVLYEGQILDGRNRYQACQACRPPLDPIPAIPFEGTPLEAVAYVVSLNDKRRHLTSSQRAACEYRRAELVEAYGAVIGDMVGAASQRERWASDDTPSQTFETGLPRAERSVEAQRAKRSGTNRQYIHDMKEIGAKAPDAVDFIISGERSVGQVLRDIHKAEALERLQAFPSERYRVLYADPPWSYGSSGAGLDQYGPAERHYPSMTIAELCALDVQSLTDDNAVLFLWVTSPLLDEVWPVIKAWGFAYATSFIWDKVRHNFGHYNSVRHELLLICTRGSCLPDVSTLLDSVQSIERIGTHSQKPPEFYAIIESLYPYGKRLELFARGERDGWDQWGTEPGEAL